MTQPRISMNITYKLTLDEYQKAVNFHYKTGTRPLMLSIYAGLATFMILLGTDFSNTREVITNIFIVFFFIAFYILFTRLITAFKAKRIYNKSPILSDEVTLHISGKGIKQDKQTSDLLLPWDTFSKWKKNDDFYLIYASPRYFSTIPIRAMNPAQIEELDQLLTKYISQGKK